MAGNRFYVPTGDEHRDKAWRLSVEERMETLETQQRLFNASIKGGAIQVLRDEDAKLAVNLGVGSYNQADGQIREAEVISFLDASNSNTTFHMLIDEHYGWIVPKGSVYWAPDTFIAVTSGSYVPVWKSQAVLTGLVLVVTLTVGCDSGTVGKIKLSLAGVDSSEITCAAGTFTDCNFSWNLTDKFNFGQVLPLGIQALRVSGAGNVNVYSPDLSFVTTVNSRTDATTGGIALSG